MTLDDLLTTYWSQLTLLFLAIGYFIKRIFDNISDKRKINHNLFQQNRIDALNRFFKAYSRTEQMWTSIPIYDILDRKLSAKELDEIVFPLINELKASIMELQIYFEEKDHKHFKKIGRNVISIKINLGKVYFDYDSGTTKIIKSNNFQYLRDQKLKENENILKQISQIIQKHLSK